jgi:ABC-type transport system involved in multi-copper enzyme maturation permease subunit
MNVFGAMLLDSYRELNSKKLFWISLGLSLLVVLAFAALGITEKGITVLWFELPIELFNTAIISESTFYKLLFSNLGVQFWLAWVSTILALVSTAGMIPDFIAGGAIELTLSKPVTRAKLFIMKYICGLLFTAMQVAVFTTASFLVIGIRGGEWIPALFLSVPLVVLFYSYLFSVCALVGMITRSTIAALLVTMLFWVALFAVNTTDAIFVQLRNSSEAQIEALEKTIVRMEKAAVTKIESGAEPPAEGKTYSQAELDTANPLLPLRRAKLSEQRESLEDWKLWSQGTFVAKTILPKTTETVELLERKLVSLADIEALGPPERRNVRVKDADDVAVPRGEAERRAEAEFRKRPVWWIIGTSIGFEFLVLGIATLIFCRRDF